jgi:N-acetyl-gamma-glutamyl-phosphate reductase
MFLFAGSHVLKIGIVGGTGYTGVELIRLLAGHPSVSIEVITSRGEAGTSVDKYFPNLRGKVDLQFTAPDTDALKRCDVVFFATPNGIAMRQVPDLLDSGVRVIDLAADFRLTDPLVWQHWYGEPHVCPKLLSEAIYGLPELNREAIRTARLIANPGCYPTAVQLGFLPVIRHGLVDNRRLIADAKSGVSGAGRGAKVSNLHCEVAESFKAYGASGHRHLPEIKQGLSLVAGEDVGLTFVPHLIPMIRGIEATLYAEINTESDFQALYEDFYRDEPFVDVMPFGSLPETRTVKGTNLCRIALHRQPQSQHLIVVTVIDNLVKGAAGQAVQNMNLMTGLPETAGLDAFPMLP